MKTPHHKSVVLLLAVVSLWLVSCQEKTGNYVEIHPAHIEHIEGSPFSKLELTDKAIERTDIKIGEVAEELVSHSEPRVTLTIPYAALIYGPHGETWVYTNPESHTYVRAEVKVDFIRDNKAYLMEGPPVGAKVVSQGAAELYGAESGVGH